MDHFLWGILCEKAMPLYVMKITSEKSKILIHHSMIPEEANSNMSSGLSVWDRLHKTMRLNIPQRDLTIGLPRYRESIGLAEALLMPLTSQNSQWILPGNGIPERTPAPGGKICDSTI